MGIYYVDLASGSDTTGNGSTSAPYQTIYAAANVAGFPHEIRVAKTPDPTTISSATFTFTNNNANISTSSSLIGTIATGIILVNQ